MTQFQEVQRRYGGAIRYLIEDYVFFHNRTIKCTKYLRCSEYRNGCRATATIKGQLAFVGKSGKNGIHGHAPPPTNKLLALNNDSVFTTGHNTRRSNARTKNRVPLSLVPYPRTSTTITRSKQANKTTTDSSIVKTELISEAECCDPLLSQQPCLNGELTTIEYSCPEKQRQNSYLTSTSVCDMSSIVYHGRINSLGSHGSPTAVVSSSQKDLHSNCSHFDNEGIPTRLNCTAGSSSSSSKLLSAYSNNASLLLSPPQMAFSRDLPPLVTDPSFTNHEITASNGTPLYVSRASEEGAVDVEGGEGCQATLGHSDGCINSNCTDSAEFDDCSSMPININVGGKRYTSTLSTLLRYPDSKLAKYFSSGFDNQSLFEVFIDRDGPLFRHILNFLRNGVLRLPANFQEVDLLLQEASFFKLPELTAQIFVWKAQEAI